MTPHFLISVLNKGIDTGYRKIWYRPVKRASISDTDTATILLPILFTPKNSRSSVLSERDNIFAYWSKITPEHKQQNTCSSDPFYVEQVLHQNPTLFLCFNLSFTWQQHAVAPETANVWEWVPEWNLSITQPTWLDYVVSQITSWRITNNGGGFPISVYKDFSIKT